MCRLSRGQDETCRLAVGDRELLFFKNIIRNPEYYNLEYQRMTNNVPWQSYSLLALASQSYSLQIPE